MFAGFVSASFARDADDAASTGSGTLTVTPAALTTSIVGNPTKTYDEHRRAADLGQLQPLGLIGGERFTVTQRQARTTARTCRRPPGDGQPGRRQFHAGPRHDGERLHAADHRQRAGQITAALAAAIVGDPTKTYDGNSSAALIVDQFSLGPDQRRGLDGDPPRLQHKDVATANTVTASLAAYFHAGSGTSASNYTLPTTAAGAGHITAMALTVTMGVTKVCDGTTVANSDSVRQPARAIT
jgi:hypothetical protein